MKKILTTLLLIGVIASSALAQDGKILWRLHIRHADPQLIYMLLAGTANFNTSPEMSTIINFGGGQNGGGQGGFGGGQGGFGGSGRGGQSSGGKGGR